MSLQSTILNVRNAKRSNNLRNEQDPQAVIKQLEEILLQSVNIQNSGSREYQTKALKELKQLRSDMVTGQINAGSKGNQYVGLYSHVIDQLEDMSSSSIESNDRFDDGVNSIRNAMPSTDSLVAALMTANPIVGYGAKIMMDITRGRREAKKQKREDQKKRLAFLKQQEEYIKTELMQQDDQQKVLDSQLDDDNDSPKNPFGSENDLYSKLLTEIRDEIKRLESSLSRNDDAMEGGLNDINDGIEEQIDLTSDIDNNKRRDAKLAQLESGSDLELPTVDTLSTNAQGEEKGGLMGLLGAPLKIIKALAMGFVGFFTGIAGFLGFGAAAAGGGMLAKLFSPIKMLINFVMTIGRFALSMGSALLLPAAIIASLYSFFDGFFNADKILGMHDKDITLGDRVLVGISNVLAMFTKVFDWLLSGVNWVLDLFGFAGFGQIDTEGLTKKIFDFFKSIPDKISKFMEDPIGALKAGFTAVFDWYLDMSLKFAVIIKDALVSVFNWYLNIWKSIGSKVKSILLDGYQYAIDQTSLAIEYTVDAIKDAFANLKTSVIAAFDNIVYKVSMGIEHTVNGVKSAFEYIVSKVSYAIEYVIESIKSAFEYVNELFLSLNLKETITEFFTELPQKVTELFYGIVDSVHAGLDAGIDYVKELGTEIFGSMMEGINSFIDKVRGVMDTITDTFKSAFTAIEDKLADWSDSLSQIPGLGRFFTAKEDSDDGYQTISRTFSMQQGAIDRVDKMLDDVTSVDNVMRVGQHGANATQVPMQSKEQIADAIQYMERKAEFEKSKSTNMTVNAPSTVNNSSKTVTSNNNTSNANNIYARMRDGNYLRR